MPTVFWWKTFSQSPSWSSPPFPLKSCRLPLGHPSASYLSSVKTKYVWENKEEIQEKTHEPFIQFLGVGLDVIPNKICNFNLQLTVMCSCYPYLGICSYAAVCSEADFNSHHSQRGVSDFSAFFLLSLLWLPIIFLKQFNKLYEYHI